MARALSLSACWSALYFCSNAACSGVCSGRGFRPGVAVPAAGGFCGCGVCAAGGSGAGVSLVRLPLPGRACASWVQGSPPTASGAGSMSVMVVPSPPSPSAVPLQDLDGLAACLARSGSGKRVSGLTPAGGPSPGRSGAPVPVPSAAVWRSSWPA
jgi:hypothetical protein